jgi:cytochrome c-type biogenesis protein CcmF
MIPEIGHFALILALLLAVAQSVLGLGGAARRNDAWLAAGRSAAIGQVVFTAVAFVALVQAFLAYDFSVLYVANNSNRELPAFYRVAAVWGAHEGSLLLWALVQALWTLAVVAFSRQLPDAFRGRVLGILGLVSIGFLLFMLATSNPFERLVPAAADGRDLNPLLQDVALAAHPPILYFGYVGFAVAFAFACAAMLSGRLDAEWARWTRPWTVAAWIFLTLGIALGSWWAYYELGWGGWWFWDPVENASFMPWLAGTALLHSLAVTEKRGLFKSWTLLLAIFAFSLSLLGTFLVRSGVLVSVHAFASDPSRGLFILAYLVVVVGGALALYAWRAPLLKSQAAFEWGSREALILINNALLIAAAGLILIGTLYPLFLDTLDLGKISVGPPYFAMVFVVPTLPLVYLLAVGMHSSWKRTRFAAVAKPLAMLFAASLLAAIVWVVWGHGALRVGTIVGLTAGLWVMASALIDPWQRLRRGVRITPAFAGMAIAHFGVGFFCVGVTMVESFKIEKDVSIGRGETVHVAGYDYTFVSIGPVTGPNYDGVRADFRLSRDGREIAIVHPEKRQYRSGGNVMTEAGIDAGLFRDLFVALGEDLGRDRWSVRVQYKPMIRFIWFGALIMALGGLVAASDGRYRRRVPATESSRAATAAEAAQ